MLVRADLAAVYRIAWTADNSAPSYPAHFPHRAKGGGGMARREGIGLPFGNVPTAAAIFIFGLPGSTSRQWLHEETPWNSSPSTVNPPGGIY